MEEFLVTIRCRDKDIMQQIKKSGGSIFEKGIEHVDGEFCFQGVVNEKTLKKLKDHIQIDKKENMKDYNSRKIALVGKGNRYLDN